MKLIRIAAIAAALGVVSGAAAQTATSTGTVIERIEAGSEGNVTIDIPQSVIEQLDRPEPKPQQSRPALRPGINKINGYRIQVFGDGINQRGLENRARARGNAIVAKFPKYRGQVYTVSSAPNWYTRIGNFRTQQEASAALGELKRAFPNIANEMRVVKSQIIVIGR